MTGEKIATACDALRSSNDVLDLVTLALAGKKGRGMTGGLDRYERTGTTEAVLCEGKTVTQIDAILCEAEAGAHRLLLTRMGAEQATALARSGLDHDPFSRTAILGGHELARGGVGIVSAGTSDLSVAAEAQRTLAFYSVDAPITADVGVAGLWRLTGQLEQLHAHRVLFAVAGMEGALFPVLAGFVRAPVIAFPSPVGYGVLAGGGCRWTRHWAAARRVW